MCIDLKIDTVVCNDIMCINLKIDAVASNDDVMCIALMVAYQCSTVWWQGLIDSFGEEGMQQPNSEMQMRPRI